jgi:hypothetical protein
MPFFYRQKSFLIKRARINHRLQERGISMDKKGLDQLLNQLHEEIKNTKAVDEKGTDLLRALEADIQSLLNRSEESQSQVRPSTIKNLQNALDHFEVTHPNLTAAISELLESLSNAGI